MSRLFYALFLALALSAQAAAQTRSGAGGRQTGGAPAKPAAARPAPTNTPAPAQTPAPGARGAANQPAAASKRDECGCEGAPLPDVLAVVNGTRITQADLSEQTRQKVRELQQEVVEARRRELDLQINSILLEAEAKKRGVSTTKLLEDEVVARTVYPTEAEAQAYFNQNKANVEAQAGRPVQFAELKDQVVAYLRGERQQARAQQFAEGLRAAYSVKVLVPEAPPPASPAERARVLATVNGKNITSGDVEDALRPLVYSVQEQVYALRRNDLDIKINDLLLAEEARKRGVTSNALFDAEVNSKTPVVTEAEAQKFYNENKERIGGEFPQVKYQIIQFLQEQEKDKLSNALAERLRKAAGVQTFLVPPTLPVFDIATDDQPTKGNPNAAVTVVEFTDFQCPSCAQAQPVLERLIAEYGDRVRFVVRDFPLRQHADAMKAAEAAEAAREQGKYWEFIPLLFRNQSSLDAARLKQYASAVGLDRAKFDAALDSGKFAEKVQRDLLEGQKVGVNSTPTFFVNGRRTSAPSYESLKAAIEAALSAPAKR